MRSPFIFLGLALLLIGLAILLTVHGASNFSAEYAGLCLVSMGAVGIGGHIVCWYLMNLQGHIEKGIGSALMIGFGNISGILATLAFQKPDAPYYRTGYSICLAMTVLCILSSGCYAVLVWKERKEMKGAEKETARILYM